MLKSHINVTFVVMLYTIQITEVHCTTGWMYMYMHVFVYELCLTELSWWNTKSMLLLGGFWKKCCPENGQYRCLYSNFRFHIFPCAIVYLFWINHLSWTCFCIDLIFRVQEGHVKTQVHKRYEYSIRDI